MSNNFLGKKNKYVVESFAILPTLMKNKAKTRETLSQYVRRIATVKGLTHVKLAQRAKALGGELSAGYVNSVIQGHVKSPKVETLQSLALGLGEPEDDLFEIARGKQLAEDAGFRLGMWAMLHREFQKLPSDKQKEIQPLLDLLKREIQGRVS